MFGHPGLGGFTITRLDRLGESALRGDDARTRLGDLAEHGRDRRLEQLQQRLLRDGERRIAAGASPSARK